jgi:hypothetical protein
MKKVTISKMVRFESGKSSFALYGKTILKRSTQISALALTMMAVHPSAMAQDKQDKNEVGLVIGATITPSQTLAPGGSLIGPTGALLPNNQLQFNSSLALGAEYDRRVIAGKQFAIFGGVDFLASPLDVKLSQRPGDVIPEYAYVFLTPHVRAKFHPDGIIAPWLSFGGGYARFSESAPSTVPQLRKGTNTDTFEFGGGIDTRTFRSILKVPIGFRLEVRDFYSGLPNYGQELSSDRQHNVVFTGGLLIRFR